MDDIGARFARALAAKDRAAMLSLLDPEVDFRGMTPGRCWEADSAAELVDDVLLGAWFEPADEIVAVEQVETDAFEDRRRVGYRFRVTNPSGTYVVEQQAYLADAAGRITWLRVMCAGFRPIGG